MEERESRAVRMRHARVRFAVMAVVGLAVAGASVVLGHGDVAAIAGWSAACIVYLIWIWATIGTMDARETEEHAFREDPTRTISDVLLIIASLASVLVVVFVLVLASTTADVERDILSGIAVMSVVLSWGLVHTLYTLRYAVIYYSGTVGGVSFNQDELPRYADFAYLAFTLGMTFQVSDTNLTSSAIRMTALRHALLSYLFGSVILASLVNLLAGFAP
ncbi:DUF1345 domain-containing protein [Herbiconiux sp. CPCC 205763]|uniref:DUF1345 domain-containing protein n=1 Tax=Herbiconiux aconitum TaxID=2970913 RepID=A0ABT2GPW4_9MICO|nr:DUF1345 domain-containing protein [Herbiconiux aconitum]MCS5716974.1 DUF1345 domain-containing protein [Herbiconiux aconitum]